MLISRYLLREIFHTFSAVIFIILLIGMSNKIVRLVGKAAAGDIAPTLLFQAIFFQVPELIAFLLPIGLFLALLLCLSRFFADNEIPVMLACGLSWRRLLVICLACGFLVMAVVGSLTGYLLPKLAEKREKLLKEEGPMLLAQTASPGRFHAINKDQLVFYVAELSSEPTQLKRIFIADQPKSTAGGQENGSVLTAQAGRVFTDPNTGRTYIQLLEGARYQGKPGEKNYNIIKFQQYQRLLDETPAPERLFFHRTMPTTMLLQHSNPSNLAEFQWRLSLPLAAPLLALLAVPLSRVSPRTGRFGRLFAGILICIIYFNLLTLSKRMVATQALSPYIGVWWVHGLLLIGGSALLAKTSGRWHQWVYCVKQRSIHE